MLEAIYLVFNEGYAATAGGDWTRPALCEDALRLGRILADLAPHEPEVHGLVALMEIQASRLRARTGPQGEPVLLLDRTARAGIACSSAAGSPLSAARRRWRWSRRHLAWSLCPAGCDCRLSRRAPRRRPIPTGCASRRSTTPLASLAPSPVVELNRAVAVAMAFGPAAGLAILDALTASV